MRFLRKIDRLSLRLALSIATLVLLTVGSGFYLINRQYRRNIEQRFRHSARRQTALIRLALEDQMLQKDRRLIRKMVDRFARDPEIDRVMILDHQGRVRQSSDPADLKRSFRRSSATCRICHRTKPDHRARSVLLDIGGNRVLRSVEPIPNRKVCHRCHDPKQRLNGKIIVDVPVGRVTRDLEQNVVYIAAGAGVFSLVLLIGIGLVFRRLITRRLKRLETTATQFAAGDLEQRVPVTGKDLVTRVERQFNQMADSVGVLLGQLREHRASLERVMNSVDDGMVVLDDDRRIIAANDAFVRRFGSEEGSVVGKVCCQRAARGGLGCSCVEDDLGECPTVACFTSGTVQVSMRKRLAPDGTLRSEEVVASPVLTEGSISHVVEVWRDITDRLSNEAKLAEYQRLVSIGLLASGIAHEVNTPLSSIGTCLEAIDGMTPGDAALAQESVTQVRRYVGIASEQVRRCGSITQQLLQLARGRSITSEVVDLVQTVALVVSLCNKHSRDLGVEIKYGPPAEPANVLASPSAVQQVVLNLALNALEASAPGGVVILRVEPGDGCAVTVRDHGPGIPAGDQDKIFEPFYTGKPTGTGLGLFVSMSLARSWGGDILVESEPGEGTLFRVVFPEGGRDGSPSGGKVT